MAQNHGISLTKLATEHPGDPNLKPTYTKLVQRDDVPLAVAEDIQRRSDLGFTDEDKALTRKLVDDVLARTGTSIIVLSMNGDGFPDDQDVIQCSQTMAGPEGYYKPNFQEAAITHLLTQFFTEFKKNWEEEKGPITPKDEIGLSMALLEEGNEMVQRAMLSAFPAIASKMGRVSPR